MARTAIPIRTRILSKVAAGPNNCWIWTGYRDRKGYGTIKCVPGKTSAAHRESYKAFIGPIPVGMQIDHLCRTHSCVNPKHLEAVTCQTNLLRGLTFTAANAGKIYCLRGHRFNEANTRRYRGRRVCKKCHALRERGRRG